MRQAGLVLGVMLNGLLVAAAGAAPAPSKPRVPDELVARPGTPLQDRVFGVGSTQFGLERRVEMYQWSRSGPGFQPVWNSAPIDSATFPAQHRNPPRLPIESERWMTEGATLGGRPLDRPLLLVLGRWTEIRPAFNRLPANLAAALQPEGNGLGSSENPLAPHIGAVRVRWLELVLPELTGRVELRNGQWQLTRESVLRAAAPAEPLVMIRPPISRLVDDPWVWWIGGGAAVLLVGWSARRWFGGTSRG